MVDWEEYLLGDDYLHFMFNDKELKTYKKNGGGFYRKIIKPATINIKELRKPKVGT